MIGYRVQQFLDAWRAEDATTQVFLVWNAANTFLAFGLLLSSFFLLGVISAPGFQRTVLLGYAGVAVVWLLSIFTIGSVYDYAVAPEESA